MPVPLRRNFDYRPPVDCSAAELQALRPGCRVLAPFGKRQLVGILVAVREHSDLPLEQLKPALQLLDRTPVLDAGMLALVTWTATYYQAPLGEALAGAIPVLLRKGSPDVAPTETWWQLTPEGKGLPQGALKRARQQARALALMQQQGGLSPQYIKSQQIPPAALKALCDKGLAEPVETEWSPSPSPATEAPLALNPEQQQAVARITASSGYQCFLLEGVTGSGKTEVYLQTIQQVLNSGKQALVLVPEIGLTPQTLARFQRRFDCVVVTLHSGLTDRERLSAWQLARAGKAGIVIGTRSAVFTPLARPGVIIIDEEHDSSFKQQDGLRYSARDVAIKRAADAGHAIVLGSATPSLESLYNAQQQRYTRLTLTQRATGAPAPVFSLLDIRHAPLQEGLSPELINAIGETLGTGNQALVFINRRGFAPALLCHDCGFVATCPQCDARLTVHYQQRLLRCHHCESQQPLPANCPTCNSYQLDFRGVGTERSEQALQRLFPQVPTLRIDRDTTSGKYALQSMLEQINSGEPAILVGTQMLAKGHHFADVTLVAVLDIDAGLFSADFRAPEKMGQLLVQVAGRAGRESKPGRVLVQTHQPDHPLLTLLIDRGYASFAQQLLQERALRQLPPYGYLALVRAEASTPELPEAFLQALKNQLTRNTGAGHPETQCLGPLPAPMTKRAGRFRIQLLLQARQRQALHRTVAQLCADADSHPLSKKVRWHIDIDPLDTF